MAWSGKTGTVTVDETNSSFEPAGQPAPVLEVTSWTADNKARLTSFPHSDSALFDDVAIGSYSLQGTIEVKLQKGFQMTAGDVMQMVLANAAVTLSGLAVIESMPISTRIQGGQAVSAVYHWRSKLAWVYAEGTGLDGNT